MRFRRRRWWLLVRCEFYIKIFYDFFSQKLYFGVGEVMGGIGKIEASVLVPKKGSFMMLVAVLSDIFCFRDGKMKF